MGLGEPYMTLERWQNRSNPTIGKTMTFVANPLQLFFIEIILLHLGPSYFCLHLIPMFSHEWYKSERYVF